MSTIIELIEAVKTKLGTEDFGQLHTVERVYTHESDRSGVNTLEIYLSPGQPEIASFNRSANQWDIPVVVAITKTVSNTGEQDALIAVAEQIKQLFPGTSFAIGGKNHNAQSVKSEGIYDHDMLKEQSVFQSVMTINFRVTR